MISMFTFRTKNSSPLQKHSLSLLEINLQPLETINPPQVYHAVVFCTLRRPRRTFITSSVLFIRCAEFANS